jgi:two-component system, NtrC family, sensor kinase
MKIGRGFPDLLVALARAASPEDGLHQILRRLVRLAGAAAGALVVRPAENAQIVVTAGARDGSALATWLRARLAERGRRARIATAEVTLSGRGRRHRYRVLRMGLGLRSRPVGELILVAPAGRARLAAEVIPAGFAEELGLAVEHAWRFHQQTTRLRVLNGLTALMAAPSPLHHTYARVGEDLAHLVQYDALAVLVREREQGRLVPAHLAVAGRGPAAIDPMPTPPAVARWLQAGHRLDSALDPTAPPAVREWMLGQGFRSAVLVPLTAAGDMLGALIALHRDSHAFTDADAEAMADLARPLASAIENARLYAETARRAEESQRRARQNEALLNAGRAVSRSLDLDETIDVILHQAREVLGADSGGLFTLDEASGELRGVRSLDVEPARFGQIRIRVGEGITGQAVLQRRMLQSADLSTDPPVRFRQIPGESGLRSMLVAPLVVGDRALGALTVLRRRVHEFTADEQRLVGALADQAAMALEHARLFSSEKRLVEVVLDTIPLGLYVLDRGLSVVRHNPAAVDALGVPAPPHTGLLDMVSADRAPALEAFLRRARDAGAVEQLEIELPAGGALRTFRLTAAPLSVAEAAETTHVVLLAEDITLHKRLQQQMLLTERLTTAGRLAAGVANELNNPLATIAGCAESLRERSGDATLKDTEALQDFPAYLGIIEEEAFRCKEITGSLLQFVREPGGVREPTDLNALVEKVLALLCRQSRFAQSRTHADLEPGLPIVVANEGLLRQVFVGISSNALEATQGHGPLTVRTRTSGPEEVTVEFIDEGPGIADDVMPRVFDPFFTTKPPGQGTGLGLAIAQGIVNEHGGRIELQSRLGAGATFRVVLPVGKGAAA